MDMLEFCLCMGVSATYPNRCYFEYRNLSISIFATYLFYLKSNI